MKKTIVILVLFFVYYHSNAQIKDTNNWREYQYCIAKGWFEKEHNNEESLKYFERAFKLGDAHMYDYLQAAIVSSYLDNKKAVYKYLELSCLKGAFRSWLDNKEFDKYRKTKHWKKLEASYPELRKKCYSNYDVDLILEIKALMTGDQLARSNYFGGPFIPDRCPDKMRMGCLMYTMDSLNFEELKRITDEYGLPGYNLLPGSDAEDALAIMYSNHHSVFIKKMWEHYKDIFYENLKTGNINSHMYASLCDQYNLLVNGYQLYGTQSKRGSMKLKNIHNIKELDKRRLAIGMLPLDASIKRKLIRKPDGYIPLYPTIY